MALQDSLSGNFGTSNQYIVYYLEMIENSTNTAANTSNVTIRVWVKRTNTGYTTYGTGTVYCTIAGSQYSAGIGTSQKITSTPIVIFEKTVDITHNGDGTGRVDAYAQITMDVVTSSNQGWGFGLTTIPRASVPTLSTGTADAGTTITIYTNRQATIFDHHIYYTFGSVSAVIADGVTDSVNFTIPLSLLNQIPNATSGWGTITVDTYNSGNYIGSNSINFTVTASGSIVPSFASVTASEANTAVSSKSIGSYVQSLSTVAMAINGAAGAYSSTITGYSFTLDGVNYSGGSASVTSNTIKGSGTLTLTATITDSRGRTASRSISLTVLAYTPPSISTFTLTRCNSDGTANTLGTSVKATRGGTWNSLNNKNTLTINLKSSPRGANSWTTNNTISGGTSGTYSDNVIVSTFSATGSFDFRLEFTDLFNTTIALVTLPTGQVTMSWGPNGIGLGKVWEQGTLDVNGDAYVSGDIYTNFGNNKALKVDLSGGGIIGSADFNTMMQTGFYRMNTPTNSPVPSPVNPGNWWYLQVIRHDSGWGMQLAFDYRDGVHIRRWWDNGGNVTWDAWRRLTDDRRLLFTAQQSGQQVAANTWARVDFNPVINDASMYNDSINMFSVNESGWFEVSVSCNLNISINVGVYIEIWGNPSATSLVSLWTPTNGWNTIYGSNIIYLNAGTNYEVVFKHTDGGYTRNFYDGKLSVKRI
jgi:hypothetical protein